MSLPDNVVSSSPVTGDLLYPDNLITGLLFDYEMGGIALNDGSQGLNVQPWVCYYEAGEVKAKPMDDLLDGTVLFAAEDVQWLSFSFDRSMAYAVAWVDSFGAMRFRWFDSLVHAHVTSSFPGCRTPRVFHDDKRDMSVTSSDVVLCYLKGSQLCARQQRDRYSIEYVLKNGLPASGVLQSAGMNSKNRIQFVII